VALSSVALVGTSPILFIVAIAVGLTSRGKILYAHERLGMNGRPFRVLKFRSMYTDISGPSLTVDGDARVTPVGKWLRRYKLDELPQLINVLRGDMSLVGPRPEVSRYVNLYREAYETILSIRPGITDFASVAYRHEERVLARSLDPERTYVEEVLPKKIELNLRYVREMSLRTDLRVIIQTLISMAR
jgi:lipopolysaccharide/colanic/teichoic acid biosynthesis glycosyltransferase